MTALAEWENFYVIVGSAAGALIGLQFVVVTLIVDSPTLRVAEGVAAFATPRLLARSDYPEMEALSLFAKVRAYVAKPERFL
jgi:hypothetical protein